MIKEKHISKIYGENFSPATFWSTFKGEKETQQGNNFASDVLNWKEVHKEISNIKSQLFTFDAAKKPTSYDHDSKYPRHNFPAMAQNLR